MRKVRQIQLSSPTTRMRLKSWMLNIAILGIVIIVILSIKPQNSESADDCASMSMHKEYFFCTDGIPILYRFVKWRINAKFYDVFASFVHTIPKRFNHFAFFALLLFLCVCSVAVHYDCPLKCNDAYGFRKRVFQLDFIVKWTTSLQNVLCLWQNSNSVRISEVFFHSFFSLGDSYFVLHNCTQFEYCSLLSLA